MFRSFFGPRVVSFADRSFTDSRELLRNDLRHALGLYLNILPAPESFDPASARALLGRIHDDSSMGVLLSIVKSINWDLNLRREAVQAFITATGIFVPDIEGRDIRPTELPHTILEDETTRATFYDTAEHVFDSIPLAGLTRISTYEDFFALRCLIVDAYKRNSDAGYIARSSALTRTAQEAVAAELRSYIAEIDAKTEAAAGAGVGAEAMLFLDRLTGTESGMSGKSCAQARLHDLEGSALSLGMLLSIANHTWGSHSNARIMRILINALDLIPSENLTPLNSEQLALVYKLVQKNIHKALIALPETHRERFGLPHLHHLKAKITADYRAEPRLAIERAAELGR